MPSLTLLLRGGALRTLRIVGDHLRSVLLNEDSAAPFCAALRDSVVLRSLELDDSTGMWRSGAGIAVLQALTGHPTLAELIVPKCWTLGIAAELSVALAALIAADGPALKRVSVYSRDVGENDGELEDEDERDIARVFDALSRNRHLESVNVCGPHVSAACARQHVLPAVHACTTLRQLHIVSAFDTHLTAFGNRTDDEPVAPEYAEFFAIVRERADAHGLTS